jgi:hypothetical protein
MNEGLEVTIMEVGKHYPVGAPPYEEGPHYNFTSGMHTLAVAYANPSGEEITWYALAPAEFAFVEYEDVIFLLFRFGDENWQDAPYSFHLLERDESRVLPNIEQPGHWLLHVTFFDACTGIIVALRSLTWSAEFSLAINEAITRQAARTWPGVMEYARQLREAYAVCPTAQDLYERSIHRTKGGA